MNTTVEKPLHTNDLGYPEIKAKTLTPRADFILVQWEFCQEKLRVGKFVLARPDTHKKMHYTGTILACGPDVPPYIYDGDRIVFDQFSNFEKYWDEELGRVALLQVGAQGALFAIVPPRIEIEGSEPEFNYDV